MKRTIFYLSVFAVMGLILAGCGGKKDPAAQTDVAEANASYGGLTKFEFENGIGPVKEKMTLSAVSAENALKGEKIFEQKCFSCHRLDTKLVGPALGEVTKRRSPEFIVNMIMNPDEMTKKHPVTKQLLAEYLVAMPFQDITLDDAKLLLEYLRSAAK